MTEALTRNQQLVFDALLRDAHPRSAYTLLDDLRADGFRAPLQVYRALAKLTELGLVHKLESINAFVACAHPHQHAHGLVAFAICDRCKQTSEFSDDAVGAHLRAWASAHDFQLTQTIIEMRGICAQCARPLPDSAPGAGSDSRSGRPHSPRPLAGEGPGERARPSGEKPPR